MFALSMTQHVGIALLFIGLFVLMGGGFTALFTGIGLTHLKVQNNSFAKGYLQADALFTDFYEVDSDEGISYYPRVSFFNKYTGQEMTKVLFQLPAGPRSFPLRKGMDTIHVQYTPYEARLYDTRFQDFSRGDPYNSQPVGKHFSIGLVLAVIGGVITFAGIFCCAVLGR